MERLIKCPQCARVQLAVIKVINITAFTSCEGCGHHILVATPRGFYTKNIIEGVM